MWDALFAFGPAIRPPHIEGRERYPLDPGYGYAFEKGESFKFSSQGIAAVRILGGNQNFSLECQSPGEGDYVVFEQPEVLARWVAVRCNGTAKARIKGHVFVQSYETMNEAEFQRRLSLITTALDRGGSAYLFDGGMFSPDLVNLSGSLANVPPARLSDNPGLLRIGPYKVSTASLKDNPFLLPTGQYEVSVTCTGVCPDGTGEFYPFSPSEWAGEIGSRYAVTTNSVGRSVTFAISSSGPSASESVTLTSGAYRLLLRGFALENVRSVSIERLPHATTSTAPSAPLSQHQTNSIPPSTLVAINESLGPWSAVGASGDQAHVFAADLLGSAYVAKGRSKVSLLGATALEWIGAFLSFIVLLAGLTFGRWFPVFSAGAGYAASFLARRRAPSTTMPGTREP
jgi:hypothetical protein